MELPDVLRFCADADRVPEELRPDEPEERLPDAPAATVVVAFRSPEKRSVPFAAVRGSSALRFGTADAVRREDQSRASERRVFDCGRTTPVVAVSLMIPYYSKVHSDSQ